jgi:hypothetical protein
MDQNLLVSAGKALVMALDEAGLRPRMAMWVHYSDTDTWKLWIVPPASIAEKDKHEFYRRVSEVMSRAKTELSGFDASDTLMVMDSHPAVRGVGRFISISGLASVQFRGNTFNGYYLPEGIILRSDLNLPPGAAVG